MRCLGANSDLTSADRPEDVKVSAIHMCKSPAMLRLLLTTTTLHVDTRAPDGRTLLHICSARGDTATAAECIALGASCDAADRRQATALHHACEHVRPPVSRASSTYLSFACRARPMLCPREPQYIWLRAQALSWP